MVFKASLAQLCPIQINTDMDKVILISIPETSLKILIEQAVRNALSKPESQNPNNAGLKILNMEEACDYVGISLSHGYKLTSTNQIPHSKRGKRLFFDKNELDQWLISNKIKTIKELDKDAHEYLKSSKVK